MASKWEAPAERRKGDDSVSLEKDSVGWGETLRLQSGHMIMTHSWGLFLLNEHKKERFGLKM